MQVGLFNYSYAVCPFCRSKRIKKAFVALKPSYVERYEFDIKELVRVETQLAPGVISEVNAPATHYVCQNKSCGRVFEMDNVKHIYDRKEIKRDIAMLQKFLEMTKGKK